jgi:uncharacterized protein (TIGR03546 family)
MIEPGRLGIDKNSRLGRILHRGYERFVKIRGEPREIALGFALGLFVGMSPAMGLQTIIAIFIATLLKWNKIAAALSVWVTNPFTAPIIYPVTYYVGSLLLGIRKAHAMDFNMQASSFITMIKKTPDIINALILGGIVIGLPLAAAGYFFAYTTVKKYQDDIRQKLAAKKAALALKKEKKKRRKKKKRK